LNQVFVLQGNQGKVLKIHGHKKDPVPFLLEKQDRRKITVPGVFVKKITGFSYGCFFKKFTDVLSSLVGV
jgi:hypothetical protein